jgi:hypothetical protein
MSSGLKIRVSVGVDARFVSAHKINSLQIHGAQFVAVRGLAAGYRPSNIRFRRARLNFIAIVERNNHRCGEST